MTYSLSLSETSAERLSDAIADSRLKKYTLAWQDEDQQEFLLCIPGSSTRGVSLRYRDGVSSVRLHTLASPADWKLAINAVLVLAALSEQDIRLDQEKLKVSAREFEQFANPEWIAQRCHLGTSLCLEMVFQEQQTVGLQGWSEPYQIGPNLLNTLGITEGSDSEVAYMLLVKSMRAQQMLPQNETLLRPTSLTLASPDGKTELSSAALVADQKIWIDTELIDILALWPEAWQAQGLDPVWMPAKRLPEIFANDYERVDEAQYLLGPITDQNMLKQAEQLKQLYQASDSDELAADYQLILDFFAARQL